jgi:hypothetical protein
MKVKTPWHRQAPRGLICKSEGAPVFHEVAAPTLEERQALLVKMITRIMRLLTRRGFSSKSKA